MTTTESSNTNSVVEQLETLKIEGNMLFSEKKYQEAAEKFSQAISIDPTNAVFYSNRSAAHAGLCRWEDALTDADRTIELRPDWSKGYGRRGAALQGLQRFAEALQAFSDGLQLEPDNQLLLKGREFCQSRLSSGGGPNDPRISFEAVLRDPRLFDKLAQSPNTADYLADPGFCAKLSSLQRDPSQLMEVMKSDNRILMAVLTAMGVQTVMTPNEASRSLDEAAASQSGKQGSTPPDAGLSKDGSSGDAPASDASKAKEAGNEAYKRKDFETAMACYKRAAELEPDNMLYLLNQSAVLFEQEKYSDCIGMCEKAVALGREHRADFKQIARAFTRMATCHQRLGDLESAIGCFNKSLTEYRTPEALEKKRAVEKEKETRDRRAYHNTAIAEEERNAGNELFKQGKFADAVKHYTEAIKRDEQDPRAYSNRAACYTKLAAVQEGIKDCDTAIRLDPLFIKAYIRKAALLLMKRDYDDALAVCDQAVAADSEHKHAKEIADLRARIRSEQHPSTPAASQGRDETMEEFRQRAMRNPEVMQILSDPAMQSILQQMMADPMAAADHFKNPSVAAKIRKLIDAGIIRTAQ